MGKAVPASFLKFLTQCGKAAGKLVKHRVRGMIVISGSSPEKLASLSARLISFYLKKWRRLDKGRPGFTGLYVYHDEFDDALVMREEFEKLVRGVKNLDMQFTIYEKSDKYLGATVSVLVMDLTHDLKPNDLGRLIGIVEGGGIIILLTPPWDKWDEAKTIFKMNLTVPQYPEPRHIFIKWVKKHLLEFDGIGIYDADGNRVLKKLELKSEFKPYERKITIPEDSLFPSEIYEHALTMDQVRVLKIMEEFYEKPKPGKKKVFVLIADRGRGKSCAIGIGAVGLIHLLRKIKPKPRILVTAPEPGNIQSLMALAMRVLDKLGYRYEVIKREGYVIELRSDKFSIEYWEPLAIPRINGDVVIVDEAAGIHVPLLYKIWESHRRIVFSSTIHGYEGAGRGFSVRFLKKIKSDENTILYEYEMTEPIRYNYGDPIEEWQFKTLLLDAEPADLSEEDLRDIEAGNLTYVKYEPEELFSREDELRQLFGIYVLAHYRNEPDDLGMIADAPHHTVRAVKTSSGRIVCAVQIAREGPIDDETALELLKGSKIPGNIIPDRFLKHLRYMDFAKTTGWRIVRIATHPAVQGKGIGSWVLGKIKEEAAELGLDWVGSGFGVNEQLLRFWVKNGYVPVHISPDRNPVSGEYTVLVIQPISEVALKLVEKARGEFKLKMLNSIPVNYREMEPEIALMFLDSEPYVYREKPLHLFTPVTLDRLWTYCQGPMTFEAAADIMFKLARIHWLISPESRPKLTRLQEVVLLAKALQGLTWDELHGVTRVPVKELQKEGHEIACTYFKYLTGLNPDEYTPGVRDYSYGFSELSF
ncbi:tRNA(Met) cytidine acetyltransferase TmcA [Desulfurococcus mucosus]|uniref:tRNA(Met) cytidine acetyltransferase TmcA n=1 Tax=Desulfurococcus mucosus (strain ATCC 35584 / DSM 2162 / JCM 9187 / O7/1) TaxID=765177 RepID=E8R7T2_DESM0|nr:tRNA(Met) cytidine acetyltransferase TmcA [Desulfurococcus mucosus]ADV64558.1 domain of unknown function DUF1726 [Desulfurococcus mucosus DSM 2162]